LLTALLLALAPGTDLAAKYPATLNHDPHQPGLEWTAGEDDVWTLESFVYEVPEQLRIELGESEVVFGVHAGNAVWACVFPNKPGPIETELTGGGEQIESLYLRFHPSLIGQLFPADTVGRNGSAQNLIWARRVYGRKAASTYQWDELPVVPRAHHVVLDADTTAGVRRAYFHDALKGTVVWREHWERSVAPDTTPMRNRDAKRIYEDVWDAFDETYAGFGLLPDVDWRKLNKRYVKLAGRAETTYEAAGAIALLLSHLEDLHVTVTVGEEPVWVYRRHRRLNANWNAIEQTVGGFEKNEHRLAYGRTPEGVGYINVYELTDPRTATAFDQALGLLGDTWGLVLDLRFNTGGGEDLARAIGGRFLSQEVVYSVSQVREGSRRDSLGPELERRQGPRPWRYKSPVVVLCGRRTMGAAETLVLMLAKGPDVTTMGDPTAGSSGNPKRLELDGKIVVELPTWRDMDSERNPIEHIGVAPDVTVDYAFEELGENFDPVLARALARLGEVPESERVPGRR
jgi:hypothetical protein